MLQEEERNQTDDEEKNDGRYATDLLVCGAIIIFQRRGTTRIL